MSDPRMHFHALSAAGWSLRAIAAHAGTSPSQVSAYMAGIDLPHVAAGLLRIDAASLPERTTPGQHKASEPFVSRVGTVRRIQALMFMGWSHAAMQEHCGLRTHLLLAQQGRWVTRTTHDKVAAMYRALSHRDGGNSRAATWAKKLGHAGPAAWEDIDHDEAPEKDEQLCVVDGCVATAQWVHDGLFAEARTTCRRHRKAEAA